MKKRLLVTGASGFLGQHICNFPQNKWEIIGTYFNNPDNIPEHFDKLKIDFNYKENFEGNLEKTINNLSVDAILHLAANSNVGYCEANKKETNQININSVMELSEYAKSQNIPFLFVSTEQVFDGLAKEYAEAAIPSPKNIYGLQKSTAEALLEKAYQNACICRISVLFGKAKNSRNFMTEWLQKWKNDEEVTVFHDEIRTFLSGDSAAEGLFFLLNNFQSGIFHLAGKEAISRLDFANLLAESFNIKNAKIKSISQKDLNLSAYRPPILNLKCLKIEAMGFELKSVKEELARI